MIHMLQCLCGPARHAIMGILYDDKVISPEDAKNGLEALIEMQVDHGMLNRRCEICDKEIVDFYFEDGITKQQDWSKAMYQTKALEEEQRVAQIVTKALRKAGKN